MTMKHTAAVVILAATTLLAQSSSPSVPAAPGGPAGSRPVLPVSNAAAVSAQEKAKNDAHLRIEEMGDTLAKMHTLLKQMQAKTAASTAKDSIAKANLELWELMLNDLDKQYDQMRNELHAREDLEARRAAMYKQSEDKAAAARAEQIKKAAQGAAAARQGPATPAESTNPAAPAPSSSPN